MNEAEILDTRRYMARIGAWPPIPDEIKPDQWLNNFTDSERPYAIAILESFIYITTTQVDKLFVSSFRALSELVGDLGQDYLDRKAAWLKFRKELIVTYPTDEHPSVTDSGYAYARRARQLCGVNQLQIMTPEAAVAALTLKPGRPLIMVDDFVGSGTQFLETWARPYGTSSLQDVTAADAKSLVVYMPILATTYSINRVSAAAPSVIVRPTYELTPEYSANTTESKILPAELRPTFANFVTKSTGRAGVPWCGPYGFHSLATAIALEKSIPDSNLPILWQDNERWTALMRRT